jgi:biopolymer transport protein TolR
MCERFRFKAPFEAERRIGGFGSMAIENGHGSGTLKVDINVTPLIDVLLVVLIIFMIVVPALPYGLDTEVRARPKTPIASADAAIVVEVLARGGQPTYKINQQEVALHDLGGRLGDIFSARANKGIAVKADDNLDYSAVAQVVGIAKAAGADHIRLITPKNGI